MRGDIFGIIAKLSQSGLTTYLTTNGWSVTADVAAQLASSGLTRLLVSLDSPRSDQHDDIRLKSGSYLRTLRAVHNAASANLAVWGNGPHSF